MIFKYEIVDAVNSLGMDVAELASRVYHLEERVTELEKKKYCIKQCENKTKQTAKKGPGRPKKCDKK